MQPPQQNRRFRPFPTLCPILDYACVFPSGAPEPQARSNRLQSLARELAAAGVTLLQYRNKLDDDLLFTEDALAIRAAAPQMKLILNDRAGLVAATGCDGVHLGQDDLSPSAARALLGPRALIGFSTHNPGQVSIADRQPVDYIAIGPVFPTLTKSDASPVIGLAGVARARALTAKPLVAIGGITLENAPSVYDAGADSVAVISAIFAPARSPGHSARDFLRIFE